MFPERSFNQQSQTSVKEARSVAFICAVGGTNEQRGREDQGCRDSGHRITSQQGFSSNRGQICNIFRVDRTCVGIIWYAIPSLNDLSILLLCTSKSNYFFCCCLYSLCIHSLGNGGSVQASSYLSLHAYAGQTKKSTVKMPARSESVKEEGESTDPVALPARDLRALS